METEFQDGKRRIDPVYPDDRLTDTEREIHNELRNLSHHFRLMSDSRGGQKQILFILSQEEQLSQRKLMDITGIKSGSLSEVLGKLEHAGLIERTQSTEDRRSVDIRLTEQGQIQARLNHADFNENLVRMYSCLTAEEKDTLLTLIRKLNADWKTQIEENPERGRHKGHHHEGGHHGMEHPGEEDRPVGEPHHGEHHPHEGEHHHDDGSRHGTEDHHGDGNSSFRDREEE